MSAVQPDLFQDFRSWARSLDDGPPAPERLEIIVNGRCWMLVKGDHVVSEAFGTLCHAWDCIPSGNGEPVLTEIPALMSANGVQALCDYAIRKTKRSTEQ